MTYEETNFKASKGLGKKVVMAEVEKLNTGSILWILLKRHKFGLVAVWAVVSTALWALPGLPAFIAALI